MSIYWLNNNPSVPFCRSEAVVIDNAGDVLNGMGGNDLVIGGDGDDTLNIANTELFVCDEK